MGLALDRERIADWLRAKIDWWSPPYDAPKPGQVLIVGEKDEVVGFEMGSPGLTVSITREIPPLPKLVDLAKPEAFSVPRTGVVVRIGRPLNTLPEWLLRRAGLAA